MSQALLLVLLFLVVAASFYDLLTYTIPNTLNAVIAVLFPLYAVAAGFGLAEVASHGAVAFAILVAGILMFARGWIGGGEAKVVGVTAPAEGPTRPLLDFFVVSAIAGAGLGLMLLSFRRLPLPASLLRIGWLRQLHDPKMGVPYGVAFGMGLVATLAQLTS